jgi:hypothetical protein
MQSRGDEANSYDTNHDTKQEAAEAILPQVIDNMVELVGIEPTTSSLRKMASANSPQYPCPFQSRVRSITFHKTKIQGLPGELPHSFSGSSRGCGCGGSFTSATWGMQQTFERVAP